MTKSFRKILFSSTNCETDSVIHALSLIIRITGVIKVIYVGCDSKLGQEFHVQNNHDFLPMLTIMGHFFLFYSAHLDTEEQIEIK